MIAAFMPFLLHYGVRNFILITLGLLYIPSWSQDIHAKYHFLRSRLTEKFLKSGEGAGYSIPAAWLDTEDPYVNFNREKKDAYGLLRWSDGSFYLGEYMAVLATEYALLNKKAPSLNNQLVEEIYYALMAYRRLDASAEHLIYGIPAADKRYETNGFFMRDDIPSEFVKNHFDVRREGSDFAWIPPDYNAVSQDQIISLAMGLCLLITAVPPAIKYRQIFPHQEAKEILLLLTKYASSHNWILRSPINNKKVPRGQNMKYQAYPLCETTRRFTNRNFHNRQSQHLGKKLWMVAQKKFAAKASKKIAAEEVGKNRISIYDDVNNAMMLKMAALSNSWDRNLFIRNCMSARMEIFILLHQYLYPSGKNINADIFKPILEKMPPSGPYYFDNQNKACCEWASRDRWNHPSERNGVDSKEYKGYFPGLDYMLLHNLYYLCYPED